MLIPPTAHQWVTLPGIHGEFTAPGAGTRVCYLLTFASLGDAGTGHSALSNQMVPVRELFDVGELDFEELLQRDIDDHRVATQIVPYILEHTVEARFFPPILAVVLPQKSLRVLSQYPDPVETRAPHTAGYERVSTQFGQVLRVDRFQASAGGDFAPTAELSFNPDQSRLVVIDGQHRAMAMLAIRRAKSGNWGDRGRDYKHFYEELATSLKDTTRGQDLSSIELPVCICYLPEQRDGDRARGSRNLIQTCRKLFLDVNRTARRPTKARSLLLDDGNLISVFTRALLAHGRDASQHDDYRLTTDEIEYDSPKEAPVPRRDLALCSAEMIFELIYWALFSKDSFHNSLDSKSTQGRRGDLKPNRLIRELRTEERISSADFEAWGCINPEHDLAPETVEPAAHARFSELFMKGWGNCIIAMLERLHPFNSHIKAVVDLKNAHRSEDGHGALAYKCLFDGQGILWTVEQHTLHREELRASKKLVGKDLPVAQIELAYKTIKKWLDGEFSRKRAQYFWLAAKPESVSQDQIDVVNRSFKIFRTQAFQVGVLMAFSYLKAKLHLVDEKEFLTAVDGWLAAWNATFTSTHERRDRTLRAFDKAQEESIMARQTAGLKPSDWFWFRHLTFEYIAASELDIAGREVVTAAALESRWELLHRLTEKNLKDFRAQGQSKTMGRPQAEALALKALETTMKYCFGIAKKDIQSWYESGKASKAGKKQTPTSSDDELETNGDEDENLADEVSYEPEYSNGTDEES